MPFYPQSFPVVSSIPADGATDVATTVTVVVRFVAPMDVTTVSVATFRLFGPDRQAVSGTVIYPYQADVLQAAFQPAAPLAPASRYLVEIVGGPNGVRTTMGATFPLSFTFQFTTAAEVQTRPEAPHLLSPAHRSQVTITTPTFQWSRVVVSFVPTTDYVITADPDAADTIARTPTSSIPDGATVTVVYSDNTTQQVQLNGTQPASLFKDITSASEVAAVRMDAPRYEIQVSRDADFASRDWETITANVSITAPADGFLSTVTDQVTFYWRVRAWNYADLEGPWSDVFVFIYAPYLGLLPEAPPPLTLLESVPADQSAYAPSNLTEISLRFSADLQDATVTPDAFILEGTPLVGSGQAPSSPVALSWSGITESAGLVRLALDAATPLQPNTEYRLRIRSTLRGTGGETPESDMLVRFVTEISPAYTIVSQVRSELGDLSGDLADCDIAKFILQVSQYADQLAPAPYGTPISDATPQRTNAVWFEEYVRYEVAIRLLLRLVGGRIPRYGESVQVGDVVIRTGGQASPDASVILARLERRRDEAFQRLTSWPYASAHPASSYRGERVRPYPLASRMRY